MNESIKYTGKVTIKIKNKPPVKTRNSGTAALFNVLCNVLSNAFSGSDSIAHSYLPCYMSIISGTRIDENTDYLKVKDYSLITEPLPIASREVDSTSNSVTLSALLVYSVIKTGAIKGLSEGSTCTVVLLDGRNTILAHSDFQFSSIQEVCENPNIQAAIDWQMSFSNKE